MKVLIHSNNVKLTERARKFMQENIAYSLQRFDGHVDTVDLYLKDINGPKGGVDKTCTLSIKPSKSPSFTVSAQAQSVFRVVRQCLKKAKSMLRKHTQIRKTHRRPVILLGHEETI